MIPELKGKLNGGAFRVPTPDGSVTDFTAVLAKDATADAINAAFKEAAADKSYKGVLEYTDEPLVSRDIVGNPHSCIFDSKLTITLGNRFVKVVGWYDNEWGYSNRCVEMLEMLAINRENDEASNTNAKQARIRKAPISFRFRHSLGIRHCPAMVGRMSKLSVRDLDVRGKRVLVRVDFNVPIEERDGKIARSPTTPGFAKALPTINYLREHRAKTILMSHFGRPKGKRVDKYTLRPIADHLHALIDHPVIFSHETIGEVPEQIIEHMQERRCGVASEFALPAGRRSERSEVRRSARQDSAIFT